MISESTSEKETVKRPNPIASNDPIETIKQIAPDSVTAVVISSVYPVLQQTLPDDKQQFCYAFSLIGALIIAAISPLFRVGYTWFINTIKHSFESNNFVKGVKLLNKQIESLNLRIDETREQLKNTDKRSEKEFYQTLKTDLNLLSEIKKNLLKKLKDVYDNDTKNQLVK